MESGAIDLINEFYGTLGSTAARARISDRKGEVWRRSVALRACEGIRIQPVEAR
jgi:hypothetical protein